MSSFDSTSPAQSHGALTDVSAIRNNTLALRDHESSLEASPPSNPVTGMFHHTSDTEKIYQRTSAGSWLYLWRVSDPPALTSDLTTHTGSNITSSVTVHGIRQGSGNGLDADLIDGNHASAFLGTSHGTSTSGIHGVGAGTIVGTTLTQALTNKELGAGCSISENIPVTAGKTIDGRDVSVDGAKLDTYPGGGLATPSDGAITPPKLAPSSGAYTSAVFALDTERTFTAGTRGSYILLKSRRLYTGGLYRVSFDAYKNSDDPCNAKLFRDDVSAGTEQTLTGTYQTFTEDITFATNNVLQLKVQVQSGTASDIIYVRNFRAYLKFMESVTVADASV